jgi:uncharacterized protein
MPIGALQEAFFLPRDAHGHSRRLAIHHRPADGPIHGAVVYVHPFAEEMNKARRMAAQQSRAFARAGFAVLQLDLLGCGDSSGDHADATWDAWVDDIVEASRWLRTRHDAPLTLWGLRAGCLLAAEAAHRLDVPLDLLFWQPATTGATVLQQFLRLELAAKMQATSGKGVLDALRAKLAAGNAIDIAGYRVAASMANAIERATLEPARHVGKLTWLEVSARAAAELLPASAKSVDRWRSAGHRVDASVVQGPSFWHSVEIEEAPELIAATLAAVTTAVAA